MTRLKMIKAVVSISFLAVLVLPAYLMLYLEPAFHRLVTSVIEQDAQQVANHMTANFIPDVAALSNETLPHSLTSRIPEIQEQFHIVKVKIFSPVGEVLYSTASKDIGTRNQNAYFRDIIAKGRQFTKVVRKDEVSMEGQTMSKDVVETYVPVMHDGRFAGAFEIYYDITATKKQLDSLNLRGRLTAIAIAAGLFVAILFTSRKAIRSVAERNRAEDELRRAHDELELRVERRTAELKAANEALTGEIAVRHQTELEKEKLIGDLQKALQQVKTLRGLLPICANCQQIRDDQGNWNRLEIYIQNNSDAEFTHGICPQCAQKLYPDLYDDLHKS